LDLNEVIQQLLKDLNKEAENSKKIVSDLEKAADNVKRRRSEVKQQKQDAISKVKESFRIIREECDTREKTLISSIQSVVSKKLAVLKKQLTQIQTAQSDLSTLQEEARYVCIKFYVKCLGFLDNDNLTNDLQLSYQR
jgi:hypothetical protein